MKYLFIDESGDHNLISSKIDPKFPFFVLTAVVFESKDYQRFKRKVLKLKKRLFKNEKIILHSKELTHPVRTKQKELNSLTETDFRKKFYKELNILIQISEFEIFVYTIDKRKFNKTFKSVSIDIYFLSFENIFKKFEKSLKFREHGKVFVESRNKNLDKQFLLTWQNTKITKRYKPLEPKILLKSWKHAGLELADLISYRLSRNLSKKPIKPVGNEIDLSIIMGKKVKIDNFEIEKEKHIRTSP